MIIFQPVPLRTDQNELSHLAVELARNLIPRSKILSSQALSESAHLRLKEPESLSSLDLFSRELGEEAFEITLRTAADLELKRKEQSDPSIKGINVYLLAKSFSKNFLARVHFGVLGVRLFEWKLICSEGNDAVLISEIREDASYERITHPPSATALLDDSLRQEFSTPELVAFVRLGMELRGRRSQITHPV